MDIRLDEAVSTAVTIGTRLATAAIIMFLGYLLAIGARRLTRKLLERPNIDSALGPSMVRLLSSAVYFVLLALAVGLSLIALGVPSTFVLAAAVIIVIVLGLALQQSVANFAATVIFLMFQPFKRGDLVMTMGYLGIVREILLFNTVILTAEDRLVSLPNSKIQESGVANYSGLGYAMPDFALTVGYKEDVARVRAIMAALAADDKRILTKPPFLVIVEDLGENGVRLHAYMAVAPRDYWAARNDLRERIKARFDAEGIKFAMPRLDLHLAPATSLAGRVELDAAQALDGQTSGATSQQDREDVVMRDA